LSIYKYVRYCHLKCKSYFAQNNDKNIVYFYYKNYRVVINNNLISVCISETEKLIINFDINPSSILNFCQKLDNLMPFI